jgi:DnaJ-class molecular chaperone
MAVKNYYEILGIREDAKTDDVKKAYRRLAKKYHPDLHPGDKETEARFKEINEAHDILNDPKKRAEYDALRRAPFEPGFEGARYTSPGGINFEDLGFGLGGIEDIFGEMFGRGRAEPRRPQPARGRDIDYEVPVDFDGAIRGIELRITVDRRGGKEKLNVKVPAGVRDGSRVRVAGKGGEGIFGGPPGDLYIVTNVKPHPYFRREGNDIYIDVPITVTEATVGGRVTIPNIEGKTTVKIPPGTQSGQMLKIKEKGVRHIKGGGRGDMYAVIKVVVPKDLSSRTRELFEEIEKVSPYNPREGLWNNI